MRGSSRSNELNEQSMEGEGRVVGIRYAMPSLNFFSGASREARRENVAGLSGGGCFGEEEKKKKRWREAWMVKSDEREGGLVEVER